MFEMNEVGVELAGLQSASEKLDGILASITEMEAISDIKEPDVNAREIASMVKQNLENVYRIKLDIEYNPYQQEASMEGLSDVGKRVYKLIVEVAQKIAAAFRRLLNLILGKNEKLSDEIKTAKEGIDNLLKDIDETFTSEGLEPKQVISDEKIAELRKRGLYVVVDSNNRMLNARAIKNDITKLADDRIELLKVLGSFVHDNGYDPITIFESYTSILNKLTEINAISTMNSIYNYIITFKSVDDIADVEERITVPLETLNNNIAKSIGLDKKGRSHNIPSDKVTYTVAKTGLSKLLKIKGKANRNKRKARVDSLNYDELKAIVEVVTDLNGAIANAQATSDELTTLSNNMDANAIQAQMNHLNKMAARTNPDHYNAVKVVIHEFTKYIETLANNFSIIARDATVRVDDISKVVKAIEEGASKANK